MVPYVRGLMWVFSVSECMCHVNQATAPLNCFPIEIQANQHHHGKNQKTHHHTKRKRNENKTVRKSKLDK